VEALLRVAELVRQLRDRRDAAGGGDAECGSARTEIPLQPASGVDGPSGDEPAPGITATGSPADSPGDGDHREAERG
jgi:hypothetical protein